MVEQSAATIILEYVCPSLGIILCQFMFSAPYRHLQAAISKGSLGDLNPTPWAFMLGNCLGWVTYSIMLKNQFIFWANAPGFLLSIYLNLGAVKLLYSRQYSQNLRTSMVAALESKEQDFNSDALGQQDQEQIEEGELRRPLSDKAIILKEAGEGLDDEKKGTLATDWASIVWKVTSQAEPAPAPHEKLVLLIVTIWTVCISLVGFGTDYFSWDADIRELIVGSLVNFNLVFFYGAPLSTIYQVFSQRNTSSIHIRTMVTNTLNSTFWTAYGFAINDFFIYVPNGLGCILGAIQIVLLVLFPRKHPENDSQEDHDASNKQSISTNTDRPGSPDLEEQTPRQPGNNNHETLK